MFGGAGNDTLDGGLGNDTLNGAAGADTYRFGRGWGTDTIIDNDATAGVVDKIEFGASIVLADLTFTRVGNDLSMSLAGGSDKLVVKDWYLGTANHIEQLRFTDGTVLTDAQAQARVLSAPTGPKALATDTLAIDTLAIDTAGWSELVGLGADDGSTIIPGLGISWA